MAGQLRVVHVSPSQIKLVRDCRRKYAFQYNEKIRPPQSAKQEFGERVHLRVEHYLPGGVVPELTDDLPASDRVEIQALKSVIKDGFLPTPDPRLLVEHEIHFIPKELEGEGIVFVGYMDFGVPPLLDPIPTAGDLKTTTDARYMMTPEEFDHDPQRFVYSKYIGERFGARYIRNRWVYIIAPCDKEGKNRRVKPARKREGVLDLESEMFAAEWAQIIEDARLIARIRRAEWKGLAMPPSPQACGNYGGCFFKKEKLCALSGGQRLAGHILSAIAFERKQLQHRRESITRDQTLPTTGKEEEMPTLNELLAKKAAQMTGGAAKAAPAAKEEVAAKPAATTKTAANAVSKNTKTPSATEDLKKRAVNPPEGEKKKKQQPDEEQKQAALEEAGEEVDESSDEDAADEETLEQEAEVREAAKNPAKKNEAKRPQQPDEEVKQGKRFNGRSTTEQGGEATLVVYFDCAVVKNTDTGLKGRTHQLHDILEGIEAKIEEALEDDWSSHPQGRALLRNGLKELLEAGDIKGLILVPDSSTEEARTVRHVLMRYADIVVQGR